MKKRVQWEIYRCVPGDPVEPWDYDFMSREECLAHFAARYSGDPEFVVVKVTLEFQPAPKKARGAK